MISSTATSNAPVGKVHSKSRGFQELGVGGTLVS